MKTIWSGLLRGVAFGIATACFEVWFGAYRMMSMRMPPTPESMGKAALLEVALGAALGLLASPVLRLKRGGWIHALAMAAAWLALERTVAPDPNAVPLWLGPPLAGLVLYTVGWLLVRWRPLVPWVAGVVVLSGVVIVPPLVHRRQVAEIGHADRGSVEHAGAERSGATAASAPGGGSASERPDVLVVVLDTVRAQSTSAYGYARPTTPYLEKLAREGALFLDATSPSTWSLPSHASLFTGRFPSGHGAHEEHRFLDAEAPTLAEVLARDGYETRCFTANPHISDGFGLTRGFEWSDRAWMAAAGGRSFVFAYRVLDLLGVSAEDKGGASVARNFELWIAARPAQSKPAFSFINFLEAHFPYHQVPREFLSKFTTQSPRDLRSISLAVFGAQFGRPMSPAEVEEASAPSRDMYDAGVAYSDYLLERVVEAVRRAGTLDRTVLVVLADHGEMVGEHGQFGHGAGLYEPAIRVPLLVRYPPRVRAGVRPPQPVSTVGVYATVLDLAGLSGVPGLHVSSLLPAVANEKAGAPAIAERFAYPKGAGAGPPLARRDRRYRVYRSGASKLVQTSEGETFLFDLRNDPNEEHDVAAAQRDERARLRAELADWSSALALPPIDAAADFKAAPALDPAARERLKALGYTD